MNGDIKTSTLDRSYVHMVRAHSMLGTRPLRKSFSPLQSSLGTINPRTSERDANILLQDSRGSSHFDLEKSLILHVGCGSRSPSRLHKAFQGEQWQELRCDIDPENEPDILASITDMRPFVSTGTCDAIWASHILEHLARHEVGQALSEFHRVLKPNGFAVMRSPDIEAVAQFIVDGRISDVIYTSPAGPITPLDMIYGHGAAIAGQRSAMRHGTAFTQDLLGQDLLDAGFSEVRTTRTTTYEVWAVALKQDADTESILSSLEGPGISFRHEHP